MTRKLAVPFIVAAMIALFAAMAFAMSDHDLNGFYDSGQVGCQAFIDDMQSGLDSPGHTVEVVLFAPSGDALGAYTAGNNGLALTAGVSRQSVGSGTYHCRARFQEWYDDSVTIVYESDQLDYYVNVSE